MPYTKLGMRLNSSVLERGLKLLRTLKNLPMSQKTDHPERLTGLLDKYRIADWSSQKIRIDVSDPLNLKVSWSLKSPKLKPGSPMMFRSVPLTIQIGNRNFSERIRTFQNIFPIIEKQHPELESIDLRYDKRVMLIPL